MRLVDIHLDADRPVDVELHERLTVVLCDPVARMRLASVLARAFVVAGHDLWGTVEQHGWRGPLDPSAVVGMALAGDGLPVMGADRLPPPDPTTREVARAQAEAAATEADQRVRSATEEVQRTARLDQATAVAARYGSEELEREQAALAATEAELAGWADRPAALAAERDAVEAEVASATARRTALEGSVAALGAVLADAPPGGGWSPERVEAVAAALAAVIADGAPERGAVGVVAGWLAELGAGRAAADAAAQELADAWVDHERRWAEAATTGVEGDPRVVAARTARTRQAEVVGVLEELAASGLLGRRARTDIEAAHAAVAAASGRHRAEAEAAETATLGRYGFDSYLDFSIAVSTRTLSDTVDAKAADERALLSLADEQLDAARREAAEDRRRLADEREGLRGRVEACLGGWPDGEVEERLRRVPAVPAALASLVPELEATSAGLGREIEEGRERSAQLRTEIEGLSAAHERLLATVEDQRRRVAGIADLVARARAEATAAARHHADAVAALSAAEAERVAAWGAVEELADVGELDYGPDDLAAVATAVVTAAQQAVAADRPLVLDETLAPVGPGRAAEVLAHLLVAVPQAQVVYLTEDTSLADWVAGRPAGELRLVRLTRPTWWQRHRGRRRAAGAPAPGGPA